MKNKIFCGIASSLQITLPTDIENLECNKIESNQNVSPDAFSMLVLDKNTHQLYSEKRFVSESNFDAIAYYDKETHRPADISETCCVFDYLLSHPGVLSHQQIATLMKLGMLIYDGNPNRVRGASYDLLIGREYLKSGIKVLSADTFKIDPLDYVVVGAVESANIPKNICASFDTQVGMFCRGIILSNGPQVDPGYQGRLLCLLFNTSAKEFEISPATDFEFATIQFNALSETTDKPYTGKYLRKGNLKDYIGSFADESIADLVKSIPDIRKRTEELSTSVEGLKKKKFSMPQLILTAIVSLIIGLIIAGFSVAYLYGKFEKRIEDIEEFKKGFSSKDAPSIKKNMGEFKKKTKGNEIKPTEKSDGKSGDKK